MSLLSTYITADHVSVAYTGPEGPLHVLSGLTFRIPAGQWVAVVGRNGCGKSTLASALLGLTPLSSGKLISGPEGTVMGVLQNPDAQAIGDTIREELALSLAASLPLDSQALRMASALSAVGLNAALDTPVPHLSGGQKQLLQVAAGLLAGASCFVLDEATSMLDPASCELVLKAVQALHLGGATVIWVTHRLEELAYADRVLGLDEGRIAFDGTPRAFFYGISDPKEPGGRAGCDRIGLTAPYSVQVAKHLLERGVSLPSLPISAAELEKAVFSLCRSTYAI